MMSVIPSRYRAICTIDHLRAVVLEAHSVALNFEHTITLGQAEAGTEPHFHISLSGWL